MYFIENLRIPASKQYMYLCSPSTPSHPNINHLYFIALRAPHLTSLIKKDPQLTTATTLLFQHEPGNFLINDNKNTSIGCANSQLLENVPTASCLTSVLIQ